MRVSVVSCTCYVYLVHLYGQEGKELTVVEFRRSRGYCYVCGTRSERTELVAVYHLKIWKCSEFREDSKSSEFNSHCTEGHVIRYSENVCCRLPRRCFAVLPTTVTIKTPGVLIHRLTDKFFAHRPLHPNAEVQQIGSCTVAYLTNLYEKYKYKHKRTKRILVLL
jgi:hypothetical protein